MASARLESQPLIITEVAQQTFYDGTVADKVEVYCTQASACAPFRVCDTSSGTSPSCSAIVPALAGGQRVVVSRGTQITPTDLVWLATSESIELASTKVGPFPCAAGQSASRRDCSIANFEGCGAPTLSASLGSCQASEFSEPFAYHLGFTENQHGGPETSCQRPLCQELLGAIDEASSTIDFALYGVRGQPAIIEALHLAEARGVRVRGVVDAEDGECSRFGYPGTRTLIDSLSPNAVRCDSGPGYSYIMHNKFFVFDEARVWTGSTNISDTELGGEYSSDVAVLFSSYRLASIYRAEFEEMYAGAFHRRKTDNTEHEIAPEHFEGQATVRSYFSPSDQPTLHAVLPAIAEAKQTLDIAMFYFTSQPIADAILEASARGVRVRMILDASGAANAYSRHTALCAAGIDVKVENWGGKSHSKWLVADGHCPSDAAVVFGSMNFTAAGDAQNDENTLYVKHSAFALEFQTEFERQWADLAQVPLCARIAVEGADSSVCSPSGSCHLSCSSGSCCDGIDNDYDGQIDRAEEACGCADGVDNDGDGYVDAEDFDCNPASADP